MTTHTTTAAAGSRVRRRPRATDKDVFDALAGAEQSAGELADDLAALVDAGLVQPVDRDGELRFAITELGEQRAV